LYPFTQTQSMKIYLAPLQGLTDWIFRESFSQHIGKFEKTFTPFIRVQGVDFYRPSQCNDLLPTHNVSQKPIPQFLGNTVESFKRFEELCLEHGYTEANINMGCPYPMVTGKRMGAGLLAHPTEVVKLLEGVFAKTRLKISIKTRLGLENSADFELFSMIFRWKK
jgi:tRNA-dihydrouridine synthase